MPINMHPAFNEEQERCQYTLGYVEKTLNATIEKKEKLDGDLERISKHFNSDNSQDYIDMIVKSALKGSTDLKLRNLSTARNKPYFARIDFKEKGKSTPEKLYIGKMCLMREEDQEIIIIDWRAPASNLYYEGRIGEAEYTCPEGNITGELLLKRQISINKGVLENIFDIDITANDELLQACLGANAENRLKDIVSTIQAEQNMIIRSDMWKPLIVQGAAGSGKTTIALHRIAYLIYNLEKAFVPENFMIVAPNKLFLNYISEVLPELGVEKVRQTTFEEFAIELIGKKVKIRDTYEKLILFVDHNVSAEQKTRNELLRRCARLKSSMYFKKMLDRYVSYIEKKYIPKRDFKVGSTVIVKYEEINSLFLNDYKYLPAALRINEIKKRLASRLRIKSGSIYIDVYSEKELDKRIKKSINDYVVGFPKISANDYYETFVTEEGLLEGAAKEKVESALLEFTREYSTEVINSGYIELEDMAPIIYLKYKLFGIDEKVQVKHIVIDEAQDFSAFQIYVLRKIIKDSSFTILGDLCQGIHSYRGIRDWEDIVENVFDDTKCRFLTLEQSYRTTVEIMEAANCVIGRLANEKLPLAKPVIRHGEKVTVLGKSSVKEIAEDISRNILEYKNKNYKSIAVICKTLEECKLMLGQLKNSVDGIYMITGKENEYKSGIVIMPSYLAKGLEFDGVFIANAGSEVYQDNELDTKLLYVAMTRPLHSLVVYYIGKLSALFEGSGMGEKG